MSTPLGDRIMAGAAAFTELNALLGTNPFRWYSRQLQQGSPLPAVVATQISSPVVYSVSRRLATNWSRWQFMIWGGQYAIGIQNCFAVKQAMLDFFDQWSGGTGIVGLSQYPNLLVGDREFFYAPPDPGINQEAVDFSIFSDSRL